MHDLARQLAVVEAELFVLGAHRIEYGRWSWLQHLRATVTLADDWGQSPSVQLAAAVQGIYHPFITSRLTRTVNRESVASLVGTDAEQRVYLSSLVDDSALPVSCMDPKGVLLEPQPHGDVSPDSSLQKVQVDVACLRTASLATTSHADSRPLPWLAGCADVLSRLNIDRTTLPPVLQACAASHISDDEEVRLLSLYEEFSLASHRPVVDDVERQLAEVADGIGLIGEPFVLLGLHALARGDAGGAADFGQRAGQCFRLWGAAWDKRMSALNWLAIASMLERSRICDGDDLDLLSRQVSRTLETARSQPEAVYARLEALELLGRPAIDPFLPDFFPHDVATDFEGYSDFDILPPRFSHFISGLRNNDTRNALNLYQGLSARPWWDAHEFPVCVALRKRSGDIKRELLAALGAYELDHGVSEISLSSLDCPMTKQFFEEQRAHLRPNSEIVIAKVAPRTRNSPRRGVSNLIVRAYFAISDPESLGLVVDGVYEPFSERHCLLFDPTFLHEEWNDAPDPKFFLAFELWHPDLTRDEIDLLQGFDRYARIRASQLDAASFSTTADGPHMFSTRAGS